MVKNSEEVIEEFLELLSPEELLQGLSPKERIQGLSPTERVQGLSLKERMTGLTANEIENEFLPKLRELLLENKDEQTS